MCLSSLALLSLLFLAPAPASRADAPQAEIEYEAAEPTAEPVTAANLLANERFWPFHVALVEAWTPPGAAPPIPAGIRGVLVRVEEGGRLRVDFGRDGVHAVPLEKTDLLEGANLVREGRRHKAAPNHVLAVSARMREIGAAERTGPAKTVGIAGFVNVFVDPSSGDFEPLVKAVAPLDGRHGVRTLLYPQGLHPGLEVAERLKALGWTGYRMDGAYAPGYTEAQLDGAPPALMAVTPDGRVVFQGAWGPGAAERLARAVDAAFADRTAAAQP